MTPKGRKQRGIETKKEGEVIEVGTVIKVYMEEVVKLYAVGKQTLENVGKSWSPLNWAKEMGQEERKS